MVLLATMLTSTVLAHFLTTGCALMLIRRGPNRRLRLLTVTVGLMSLSQTIMLLQCGGLWQTSSIYLAGIHQALIGGLSLLAIHLLGKEIYDRKHTDQRLRLIEHETASAVTWNHTGVNAGYQPANPLALALRNISEPWRAPAVGRAQFVERATVGSDGSRRPQAGPVKVNSTLITEDLLCLLGAIESHAHGSVNMGTAPDRLQWRRRELEPTP